MKTSTINKIKKTRTEKSYNRTYLKFDGVVIKSYQNGWILNIKSDESRYYSNLPELFKKLVSIKLSKESANDLQQLESSLKDVFNAVLEIGNRLEIQLVKNNVNSSNI